ncbi:hypothetical protein EDC44_1222 [Cricetibacter osteomyelitidis]|uniref:DUF6396 domain-containing protein n=1 Tax=Cricetibacter osteomyelitidis TaxID=1521931 RepID=A0A4R2SSD4_9PAST|nr:DUF6396 domain-containing protein [Cricetibacter osteomyelitidis]TCP93247.1 hypothetical protein EDC44_1222 [Cricetibacter osteomyelitidis]
MRFLKYLFVTLLFLVIAAVIGFYHIISQLDMGGGPNSHRTSQGLTDKEKRKMNNTKLTQLQAHLDFQCQHEERPERSQEVQQLYDYALYHDLHNMWTGKKGDEVWNGLARFYRIAALNGDYKANLRLQYLLKSGRISSKFPQTEIHSLNEHLAQQLPATAYYKLYGYLDIGYGVRTKKDGKYAYLRKAADLGSREAQYVVAEILEGINDEETREMRLALAEKFLLCSSQQGFGKASESLGIGFKIHKEYAKALEGFYQGVKNGNSGSARYLFKGFSGTQKEENIHFLNLPEDQERSRRYQIIARYLSDKDYLQPTVPDLDEIVPLPPAPLPEWDGKIAFQRWYEGEAPPRPSEALMYHLARQAGLDPDTGFDEATGLPKEVKKKK